MEAHKVEYVAVLEGEEGKPGSSRMIHVSGDPETVRLVKELIRERLGAGGLATRGQPVR